MTNIRQAIRALRAAPLVSALAIASIGLGIGAVATVYSTASAFTFRPLPQLARPERLLVVAEPGSHVDIVSLRLLEQPQEGPEKPRTARPAHSVGMGGPIQKRPTHVLRRPFFNS